MLQKVNPGMDITDVSAQIPPTLVQEVFNPVEVHTRGHGSPHSFSENVARDVSKQAARASRAVLLDKLVIKLLHLAWSSWCLQTVQTFLFVFLPQGHVVNLLIYFFPPSLRRLLFFFSFEFSGNS